MKSSVKVKVGDVYNLDQAIGYLDDIFLLNVYNESPSDIQRVINNGILYVVEDIYTSTDIFQSSIFMNGPETITVNSMVDDLSYIFIGRNDGKILRGSPLFWETRSTFSDSEEYAVLNQEATNQAANDGEGLDQNIDSSDKT